MKTLTRNNVKTLRSLIEKKLSELEKVGIIFSIGNITYDESSAKIKLEAFLLKDSKESSKNKKVNSFEIKFNNCFNKYHSAYSLPKNILNKKVIFKGEEITFVGLDIKRRKYPMIFRTSRKKYLIFTISKGTQILS